MGNIKFKRDKAVTTHDYIVSKIDGISGKKTETLDVERFVFDKRTQIVPKRKNRLLCIIFAEDKGCHFIWRKMAFSGKDIESDSFVFRNGMYIIDNEGIHISNNGCRVAFYLEGISTPIKMSNIEKETKTIEYIDLQGKKRKSIIERIKGLKFDAKILNTFANRRFSKLFTSDTSDKQINVIFFMSIIIIACSLASCVLTYVYR